MSWTYQDYVSQPQWFLTLLKIKFETEAEYERNNKPKAK